MMNIIAPTIAFCFLILNDIKHVELWEEWFQQSNALTSNKAKVFIHRANTYKEVHNGNSNILSLDYCSLENENCNCPPNGIVYYGPFRVKKIHEVRDINERYKNKFVAKKLSNNYTNGIFCNNAEMGKDPAPGLKKSCFCREHSDPGSASSLEPHIHISDFVKKYTIDPSQHVSTKWSSISLVHAIKALFRQCYNSGAMKCVLLSDADVPIKTFDYVYSYLTKHDKSHLDYALLPPTNRNEHYTQIMMLERFINNCKKSPKLFARNVEVKYWRYSSMWIILNHEHTKLLLKDDEIINYFDRAYSPDENYFIYLLSLHGKVNDQEIAREQTTFVNWNEPVKHGNGAQSPKEYNHISLKHMQDFNEPNILFARKFHKNSDIGEYLKKQWQEGREEEEDIKGWSYKRLEL